MKKLIPYTLTHLFLNSFCDIMVNRIITHIILIVSVLSISIVFAGYYGDVVKVGTYENNQYLNWRQLSVNYTLTGNVESMSIDQDTVSNDTITVTVTNPGDLYLYIRSIYINEKHHNVYSGNSYVFDANGYFYYNRRVPSGGFGVIRLNTELADLTPKDDVYDVTVVTNRGDLEKSFLIETSTFQSPSILNSLTPYLIPILLVSYASIYYYRRFQIPN